MQVIGVDIDETHTDTALTADGRVVAIGSAVTSGDIAASISAAVLSLSQHAFFDPHEVDAVAIGSTQFADAISSVTALAPTACIRLGPMDPSQVPPLAGWPADVHAAVGDHVFLCRGGHEFDGRPITRVDRDEILRVAEAIDDAGLGCAAITGVFSTTDSEHEWQVATVLQEQLPHLRVSLSHEIGQFSLFERENATIINSAMLQASSDIIDMLLESARALGLTAPVYLSQNDGTLMDSEYARMFPTVTLAADASNAFRGGALLAGVEDCVVVAVGAHTTSVGAVTGSYPQRSPSSSLVAGVRTNLRMPHVVRLELGGQTQFEVDSASSASGRMRLSANDLAAAAKSAQPHASREHLDPAIVRRRRSEIARTVADTADGLRISVNPAPVVLVGACSSIVPDSLPGFEVTLCPDHSVAAGAVGAASAGIGGEAGRFYSRSALDRDEVLAAVEAEATRKALLAGAADGSIRLVEVDEVPVAYLPGDFTRVRVRVVGDLRSRAIAFDAPTPAARATSS